MSGEDFVDDHPFLTVTTGLVGFFALTLVITLIGWQVGWWFTVQNAKRQGQIVNIQTKNIRKGIGYQSNLSSEIDQLEGNINQIRVQILAPDTPSSEVPALKASEYADTSQICGYAAQTTSGTLNSQQQTFVNQNCLDGAVSPSSVYAHQ